MKARIERLRASLQEPLLVTNPVSILYLTGFESSNAALLVEPDQLRLFSDFRYAAAAREVAEVEFSMTRRALLEDLAGRLAGRIGFESVALSYAGYETLVAGGLELVPCSGLVERLRAVKDESELGAIRRAAAITDTVYERIAEERLIGRTERELAWRMEQLFREHGADELAFPVIVAAGRNGALPHAQPGNCVIEPGQAVVIDAGCTVEGYCSDCTRTFATGPLPKQLEEAYAVCLEAQRAGLRSVRAGVSGFAADASAREVVVAAGLGEAFGHGLGHGVGLVVHEAPLLSQESDDELAAGNVVTIEPGLYAEGIGGVRIEDLVIVGEEDPEVLSSFTKELVTVD